jgi:hypothetical protein
MATLFAISDIANALVRAGILFPHPEAGMLSPEVSKIAEVYAIMCFEKEEVVEMRECSLTDLIKTCLT